MTLNKGRQFGRVKRAFEMLSLWAKNLSSRSSIIDRNGPVVSLTSHGQRLKYVHLTIESIARGSLLPGALVLWVDQKEVFDDPPKTIQRLKKRGLEVRLSKNYGPHTKYFPLVSSFSEDIRFVTADDDIIYPPTWLNGLDAAYQASGGAIVCYRAREVVLISDQSCAPYEAWHYSSHREPSFSNFLTGHSGVMYPPEMMRALRERGNSFESCAPRADDVWLFDTAVRNGVPVGMVNSRSTAFPVIGITQSEALKHANVSGGMNDEQISKTFDSTVIERVLNDLKERKNT